MYYCRRHVQSRSLKRCVTHLAGRRDWPSIITLFALISIAAPLLIPPNVVVVPRIAPPAAWTAQLGLLRSDPARTFGVETTV
jgi:hypothetical protein